MRSLIASPPSAHPLALRLRARLADVQSVFDRQLATDLPPVARLVRHVEHYRGKMLRPTLVLVSGLAVLQPSHPTSDIPHPTSSLTPAHITIAAVIEMVHMATLVHDDVLDEAETRRKGATINRLRGNEAAVMLGDYLIASAYHLCSTLPDNRPALAVARASAVTCTGELLQLHHREDDSLDEATYFEIIARKTARLIATACELGAMASAADPDTCARMRDIGEELGIAFQIQDDLLDLMSDARIVGKPVGKDLEKGKLTLPLIHHLAAAPPTTRGQTLLLLERIRAGQARPESVRDALRETNSIAYAREAAQSRITAARARIDQLAPTPARDLLASMADGVLEREF